MRNFPELVEAEMDTHRPALVAAVVEHDAVSHGGDRVEVEGDRRRAVQPRPPVGIEFSPAPKHFRAVALALEASFLCIEVEKRIEITRPARIQPVDHHGNPVKIFGHSASLAGKRAGSRGIAGGVRVIGLNRL